MDDASSTNGPPGWARAQIRALQRYRDFAHWWIDNRQQPDGSYSHDYANDAPSVCQQGALVAIAGDHKVLESLRRVADWCWTNETIKDGFPTVSQFQGGFDRLFSYHATGLGNLMAEMMAIDPSNRKWLERCRENVTRQKIDLWTGRTESGHLHFKTCAFTAAEQADAPECQCDLAANARVFKPVLALAQAGYSDLLPYAQEYALSWLAHSSSLDGLPKGKPRGVIPGEISFADDVTGGVSGCWWGGEDNYPINIAFVSELLLGLNAISYKRGALDPIRDSLAFVLRDLGVNGLPACEWRTDTESPYGVTGGDDPVWGPEKWNNYGLRLGFWVGNVLAQVAAQWRQVSRDTSLDRELTEWASRLVNCLEDGWRSYVSLDRGALQWRKQEVCEGSPGVHLSSVGDQLYLGWQQTRDPKYLIAGCDNLANQIDAEWNDLTSFVPDDDRHVGWDDENSEVFNAGGENCYIGDPDHLRRALHGGVGLLLKMFCGVGSGRYSLYWDDCSCGASCAVTWQNLGYDIAALVTENTPTSLVVEMHNFRRERQVSVVPRDLRRGLYRVMVETLEGRLVHGVVTELRVDEPIQCRVPEGGVRLTVKLMQPPSQERPRRPRR